MRNVFRRMQSTAQAGFTIIEVLVASVVFSFALVALASISFSIIGGNKQSNKFVQASAVAQEQIEIIRAAGGFNLGADMVLAGAGAADDVIPVQLVNTSTGNDALTSPSAMFASPDYTQNGSATPLVLSTTPQAAWVVRDNMPVAGMKTVSVVVGWLENIITVEETHGGPKTTSPSSPVPYYVVVSTAMQGQ